MGRRTLGYVIMTLSVTGVVVLAWTTVGRLALPSLWGAEAAKQGPSFGEDEKEVVQLLLESHTTWETLSGQATIAWHREGATQEWTETFAIQQPYKVSLELEGLKEYDGLFRVWMSNGEAIYEADERRLYTESRMPAFALESYQLPQTPDDIDADTVYRHPMAMLLPTPLADYIFPVALAQSGGRFQREGEERIGDRQTWLVDWTREDTGDLQRLWIDTRTGVILKALIYSSEEPDELFGEVFLGDVVFDSSITEGTFEWTPEADWKYVDAAEFHNSP
jgi:outer membrane lipoprotein-sorting protein